jgi:hypothetical protein
VTDGGLDNDLSTAGDNLSSAWTMVVIADSGASPPLSVTIDRPATSAIRRMRHCSASPWCSAKRSTISRPRM